MRPLDLLWCPSLTSEPHKLCTHPDSPPKSSTTMWQRIGGGPFILSCEVLDARTCVETRHGLYQTESLAAQLGRRVIGERGCLSGEKQIRKCFRESADWLKTGQTHLLEHPQRLSITFVKSRF